jgi:hypothetical protein
MALSAWLTELVSTLDGTVRQKRSERESRPNKSGRTATGKGDDPLRTMTSTDDEWVGDVVSSVAGVLCRKTAERFERIETRLSAIEEQATSTQASLAAATGSTSSHTNTIDQLSQQVQQLADTVQGLRTAPPTPPSSSSSNSFPAPLTDEEARTARMGNLGWNASAETLLQRLETIISEARVDPQTIENRTALAGREGGSAVLVTFRKTEDLHGARIRVEALQKTFVEGKTVWLARQRTRAERVPYRILARARDVLSEHLSQGPETFRSNRVIK